MGTGLLIVGMVSIDNLFGPMGERIVHGGGASYGAVAASLFTKDVVVVSRIGDDYKKEFLDDLKSCGIKTGGIKLISGQKSSTWTIRYVGDDAYYPVRGTNVGATLSTADMPTDYLKSVDIIHLGAMPFKNTLEFIKMIKKENPLAKISLDTKSRYIEKDRKLLIDNILPSVDFFFPNKEEALEILSDTEDVGNDIHTAGKILSEMVKEVVVVKDGSNGSYLFTKGKEFYLPVFKTSAVELTGAGDTFIGAFLANLSLGKSPLECAAYGNAAASFVVEDYGMLKMFRISAGDVETRKDFVLSNARTVS